MRRLVLRTAGAIALATGLLVAIPAPVTVPAGVELHDRSLTHRPLGGDAREVAAAFARTELYFGTLKPDGVVTEAEFFDFLDDHVTPRFPAGLTVVRGTGQFRGADGLIIREDSFILILLYPVAEYRQRSAEIDAIRRLYRRAFQQESVLRVDDRSGVRVSF